MLLIGGMIIVILSSCSSERNSSPIIDGTVSLVDETQEITEVVETEVEDYSDSIVPDEVQIQSICQLATLQCYYHNVARAVKSPGAGVSHFGETETEFWFEYTAYAELGIDFSQVTMVIVGDQVIVTLPDAHIIGQIQVLSDSITDPIYQPNAWYRNDIEITATDVSESMSNANETIRSSIEDDTALLATAKRRAQELIENYINQIAALSGRNYEVVFQRVTEEGYTLPDSQPEESTISGNAQ